MQILHLDLKAVAGNYVELRYFTDNYNKYEKRSLPLSEINDLIELAERDYYVSSFAEDYAVTGLRLYNWLDGSDRFLQKFINQYQRQGIILAISTAEKLAHLPWEVLHDGKSFLVQRSIIPVRWVSSDSVKTLSVEKNPENRALQVLFMATSPQGVEPVLDYEAEEARILEATGRQPLALTVEESGCLSELGYLVADYSKDYFDIFHITGHATITNGQPEFITETETGAAYNASAEDIATALQFRLPKLIFLSGCRTGQAGSDGDNYGSVPSMAEELLKAGAKDVLGWGQKVLDHEATEAAATLYKELAAGKQITEAVASTYQTLIKNKARDWHLLRLYAADSLPGELVTPLRTRGRKPAPPLSVSTEFLDAAGTVKVPTRESFVGRRRQLQSCLRTLTQPTEEIGVLIYGMGGLGKSSLAARLCDRLPNFQRVVLVGRIDEPSLVNRLVDKLDDHEQRKQLQNPDEELKFRLKRVFQQLSDAGEKPFLLVLDDFENNLEPRQDSFVLKTAAIEVLTALVWAIRETSTNHRLILTCRYDFEFSQLRYFYKQPLEGMRGADLRKKCSRLVAFGAKSQVDEALKSQARRLADGNPRLLEWLDKILQNSTVDQVAILNRLEVDAVELREQVLAEALLQQMDETMGEMLSQGLVFELPVPREALTAVCENIPNLADYINRAVALGLLEVSPDESLRVPRILPLRLLEDAKSIYKQAAEILYSLWFEEVDRGKLVWIQKIPHFLDYPFDWEKLSASIRDERVVEIHRLALRGEQKVIAAKTGASIAKLGNIRNQWIKVVKTCEDTLKITEDYCLLHNLALAELHLGNLDKALDNCHKALELCPLDDNGERASIINNLASIKTIQSKFDEAIYLNEQSLILNKTMGDLDGIATTLSHIASIKSFQGNFEEAIHLYQQALAIENPLVTPNFKAVSFNNIANIYIKQGLLDKALIFARQSLELSNSINDVYGQAAALHTIGCIYDGQGKHEEAITVLEQSLKLKQGFRDIRVIAATLSTLGQLLAEEREEFTTGLAYLEESLDIYQILKSPHEVEEIEKIIYGVKQQQVVNLHTQGLTLSQQGCFDEAIKLYNQSLALSECIGDIENNAATLVMLGQLLADVKEDFDTGLNYLQKSLEILQSLQSPNANITKQIITRIKRGQVSSLYKKAIIEVEQKHHEEAIVLFQQSLEITDSIGDVQGKATTLNNLAGIYTNTGKIEEAISLFQQSLQIEESIGNVQGKAATLHQLASIYANTGKIEDAIALYYQSLQITERIGDVKTQAATLNNLASIYVNTGKIEDAIALYQQSLEINESIGNVQGQAATLAMLGQLLAYQKGDFVTALDYLHHSLEILQRNQSPNAETVRGFINDVQQMANG